MTSPSATQDSYPYQNEPIWSRSEKVIAVLRPALGKALRGGAIIKGAINGRMTTSCR